MASLSSYWQALRSALSRRYYATFHNTPKEYTIRYNDVVGSYKLVMRLSDGPGMRKRLRAGTEMNERRVVEPLVQKGMVCVDVGAHVGDYLIEMAILTGATGRVIGFEAIPHYYELTRASIAANQLNHAEVRLAAVGSAPGSIDLPTEMLTGNLVVPGRIGTTGKTSEGKPKTTKVPVIRLDDEVEKLDYIKIDCEGYELNVLRGAARLLQAPQAIIFLEVHDRQLQEIHGADALEQLGRLLLEQHGFQLLHISKKHCICTKADLPTLANRRKITSVADFAKTFAGT